MLIAFARRLTEGVRPLDVVARFAGDEFLVLADGVRSPDGAKELATRLTDCLRAPFSIAGETMTVTASLGVAYSSDPSDLPEEILRKADSAMYLAKQRGRNRVEIFSEHETPRNQPTRTTERSR